MRHDGEVGSVARFQEEGQPGHQTEHLCVAGRVGQANSQLECAHDDAQEGEEELLRPDGFSVAEKDVCHEATGRTADDVQQTEHCCPAACFCLAHLGELGDVVRAQDGVDGEFGAEGAGVGDCNGHGGQAEGDLEGLLPGGSDDGVRLQGIDLTHCVGVSFR